MAWRGKLKKTLFSDFHPQGFSWAEKLREIGRMLYITLWKFGKDSCFDRAASLTFATIISLIPFAVLFVSFVGLLGGGEHIMRYVQQKILPAIVPEFQEEVIEWLQRYISPTAFKAGPAGLINLAAVIGLFMGALNILITAERVFNRIWRAKRSRPYFQKVTTFWMLLTSSPFLILASISVGNLIAPAGGAVETFLTNHWWAGFAYRTAMPIAVEAACFTLMYLFLPSIRVRFKYALVSGICAAVLWELTKRAFYLYVSHAVTIINFYKQIATIPLFFIWIFITWLIILWGCQLSYALQNKKTLSIIQRQESSEGQAYSSFFLGLFALFRLYESSIREPQHLLNSLDAMVEELGMVSMERLEMVVESLISHGFVVEDARNPGRYFLARHAGTISISDVFQVLYEEEFPLEARRVCATFGRTKNTSSDITCAIIKELFDHVKNLYGEKTLESVWKDTANAHENFLEQTLLHSQVQTM